MRKFLLSVIMALLTFAAFAVTFMNVKTGDNKVARYAVDRVEQIDYEKDAATSTRYMRTKTTDGTTDVYDVENVVEVDYEEHDVVDDTTGSFAQGVSVSGQVDGYTYVDLGLPSGLVWATYNVGASAPTEFGGYFAWGELKPKTSFSWNNYRFCKGGDKYQMTKYVTVSGYGTKDLKDVLDPVDDAATVNWSSAWRMPTKAELNEMFENCTWEKVRDFNGTGVAGYLGASINNGKTIFIPAAGCYLGNELRGAGNPDYVYLWSSTLYAIYSNIAYNSSGTSSESYTYRYDGHQIRAVADNIRPKIYLTVNFYKADSTLIVSQKILKGRGVSAPKAPVLMGYDFVGWSDSSYVNVQQNLDVYAQYVVDEKVDSVSVSGKVGDYTYVDLGLPSGLRWATANVGANKSTAYGDYFAWGETSEKNNYCMETYKWCQGKEKTFTKYCLSSSYGVEDGKTILELEDDAAAVNMGNGWRMPTRSEQQELVDGCTWTWTTNFNNTGVAGSIGKSKYNDNIIFLPAAGSFGGRTGKEREYVGSHGTYYSSSLSSIYPHECTFAMQVYKGAVNVEDLYGRTKGFSVRAVAGILYTVDFYGSDSTLIASVQVEKGKAATTPEAPALPGYEFVGWSDSSFTKVSENISVYAQYKKALVTVSGKVGNYPYVDLGLPSGLKWASYNVGAADLTESGSYFSWGETSAKDVYDWSNYKFGSMSAITKYSTIDFNDHVNDGKTVLEVADDAAAVNWGATWRMPTKEDVEELMAGCDWEWVENFTGTGTFKTGMLGTSKTNGNVIFLPDAQSRYSDMEYYTGGYYWTASMYGDVDPTFAACLLFGDWLYGSDDYSLTIQNQARDYGCCVRAVSK